MQLHRLASVGAHVHAPGPPTGTAMRDSGGDKMSELKFEAPLAQFEESEDWGSIEFNKTGGGGALSEHQDDVRNSNSVMHVGKQVLVNGTTTGSPDHHLSVLSNGTPTNGLSNGLSNGLANGTPGLQVVDNQQVDNAAILNPCARHAALINGVNGDIGEDNLLAEGFSGSLEDLVNTFDEKITKCFCNYDESVETLAPVQVRTQEEIMNECQ